jgi:hypothetical protein
MRPRDTSPEVWKQLIELHRQATPAERLRQCFIASHNMRKIVEAGVRHRHPEASEREIFLRTASHFIDRDLMIKYGWDPLTNDEHNRPSSAD